jgi:hypothetical protein
VNQRKRFVWLALAAGVALAVTVWWALRTPPGRRLKLADGRVVTLAGVTYGTEHRFVQDPPLARILAPILPPAWRTKLGLNAAFHKSDRPTLMVWVMWRGGDANQRELTDAAVFDDHGTECEPIRSQATLYLYDPPRGAIRGWEFTHFPRRAGMIGLRLYTRGAAYNPDRMAEFQFPNPAPRRYPGWTASPLPITVRAGEWEFSLVKFTTGEPIPDRDKPSRGWVAPWTSAAFRVASNGQPSRAWTVASMELTDATGNTANSYRSAASNLDGQPVFGLSAALWPDEPAWRLKVEFSRIEDFAPDELVSLKGIAAPEPDTHSLIHTQAVVQGATLAGKLLAHLAAPVSIGNIRAGAELVVSLVPVEGLRLRLVRAADDRGRELRHLPGYADAAGPHNFWLELPSDARALDLTFAVTRSRFVEFVAKPEFVLTNRMTGHP